MFMLHFAYVCGCIATVCLPIVALANVCMFGKLRVTHQEYSGN